MDVRVQSAIDGLDRLGLDRGHREILQKIGSLPTADRILNAIEKRLPEAQRRRVAVKVEVDPDGAWPGVSFESELILLADVVSWAQRPEPFEVATPTERLKALEIVRKSVESLTSVLGGSEMTPYEVTDALCDLQRDAVDRAMATDEASIVRRVMLEGLADFDHSLLTDDVRQKVIGFVSEEVTSRRGFEEYGDSERRAASMAAGVVAQDPIAYLRALQRGYEAWAKLIPTVLRPGREQAERLRVMRELTAHFRERYGSPLRAAVLDLLSAFYDTSTLTEADISKLAP